MPNTTGDYPMPYPATSVAPDGPGAILELAQEVDDTLTEEFGNRQIQTYVWANSAARNAQTGMSVGDLGWQIDANTYLQYNGSAWVVVSIFRRATVLRRTTGTVANSSAFLALPFDNTVTAGDFSHSAGVLTCTRAGTYRVTLNVSFAANSTGSRAARLLGSGTVGVRALPLATGLSAATDTTVSVELIGVFAVNNTVEAQYLQTSGGNLTTLADITLQQVLAS